MTSQPLNINTPWCRLIAEELIAIGIREVVACPGTRSAALVSALQESGQIRFHVQTDERSAAFFALGLARSSGRLVAVCVTSGSAVANLLPALTEAHAQGTPLVMLTCDRPRHLRNSGLPQTTKQAELCLPVVNTCLDLPDPTDDAQAMEAIRQSLRGLRKILSAGSLLGPVQINIPLAGKLTSVDGTHGWTAIAEPPQTTVNLPTRSQREASRNDVEALVSKLALRSNMKGLIIAGPDDCPLEPELLRLLVELSGYPLIADAPGSRRGLAIEGTIAEADFLVYQPEIAQSKPELVIRLGSAPVSNALQFYLQQSHCKVVRIDQRPIDGDFLSAEFSQLIAPDHAEIQKLGEALARGDQTWRHFWLEAASKCRKKLRLALSEIDWSELQAVEHALATNRFSFVHVANSLAIRLVNMLLPVQENGPAVYANRGVSGIDGTLGTFLGEATGHDGAGLLVIGDLAFLHDIPALEACMHRAFKGVILLMNNDGAGLFDLLPVQSLPEYSRLIRNSHRIDFGSVAQAFGIRYVRCLDAGGFDRALAASLDTDQLCIIEAVIAPRKVATDLYRLFERVTQSA